MEEKSNNTKFLIYVLPQPPMEGNISESSYSHEKGSIPRSLVNENNYYRSTSTAIPDQQDTVKSSGIPFICNFGKLWR